MIGIPVDRDRWGRSRDIVIERNANGLQADEILYAIQHVRFVGGVGFMRVGMPCPQAVARERIRGCTVILLSGGDGGRGTSTIRGSRVG